MGVYPHILAFSTGKLDIMQERKITCIICVLAFHVFGPGSVSGSESLRLLTSLF